MVLVVILTWGQSKRRWLNLIVSVDQFANAYILGDPDETISSRAGKYKHTIWYWRWLANCLDWLDPGHTDRSIEADEGKHEIGK